MLNSASTILNLYIDGVSRFTIYSVEMVRSENPEDLYYLCWVKDGWYVVFETDYIIGSLAHVIEEAAASFGVQPLHWLIRKDHQDSGSTTIPLESSVDDDESRSKLILQPPKGSCLCYAVLAVAVTESDTKRYDPNVYGYAK